jgi:hypothetical protein
MEEVEDEEEGDWYQSDQEEQEQEEICRENRLRFFPKCQNGSLLDSRPILDPESVYKQQKHNEGKVRTLLGTFRCSDTVVAETLINNKPEILRILHVPSFGLHNIQRNYSEWIGRIGFVGPISYNNIINILNATKLVSSVRFGTSALKLRGDDRKHLGFDLIPNPSKYVKSFELKYDKVMYEKYSEEDKKLLCIKIQKVLLLPVKCYNMLEQLKAVVPEAVLKGWEDVLRETPEFLANGIRMDVNSK